MEQNVVQAAKDMEKVLDVSMSEIVDDVHLPPSYQTSSYPLFSKTFFQRHGRDLFACATTWFLVDIVYYSSNLFQSQVYEKYLPKHHQDNVYVDAFHVAKLQAIIAICSTVPGYWFSVYFIDRIGRVQIQIMGFFFMAIVYFAVGFPYYSYWEDNTNVGFMFLYGLTFFFSNFGPNTTTFIVPAELFPARFRTTCHGISGAVGKFGAIIGCVGFSWASHNQEENGYPKGIGMTTSMVILGGVCMMGMVVTYFFTIETMGRSLEENENENEEDEYGGRCLVRCFGVGCT